MSIEYKKNGTSYYVIIVDGSVRGRVFKASLGYRNYTCWKYLFDGKHEQENTLKNAKARIKELVKCGIQ